MKKIFNIKPVQKQVHCLCAGTTAWKQSRAVKGAFSFVCQFNAKAYKK
jgi:hypothetical protein